MKIFRILTLLMVFGITAVFAQVNINTATAKQLSALSGIGPKKAAAIIKFRQKNGRFKTVLDLAKVDGIGEKTVKRLGHDIKTSGATDISNLKNKKKIKAKKNKSKSKVKKANATTKTTSKSKTSKNPTSKKGKTKTKQSTKTKSSKKVKHKKTKSKKTKSKKEK